MNKKTIIVNSLAVIGILALISGIFLFIKLQIAMVSDINAIKNAEIDMTNFVKKEFPSQVADYLSQGQQTVPPPGPVKK